MAELVLTREVNAARLMKENCIQAHLESDLCFGIEASIAYSHGYAQLMESIQINEANRGHFHFFGWHGDDTGTDSSSLKWMNCNHGY